MTKNPMNAHHAEFLKHRKELLALILQDSDPLPLCMRFCWAQSFLQDAPSEEFIGNRIVLLGLFSLAEMGVPFRETPELNQVILELLREYSTSNIEDPEKLSCYQSFLDIFKTTKSRFLNDPRFRDIFESAKWGNYT